MMKKNRMSATISHTAAPARRFKTSRRVRIWLKRGLVGFASAVALLAVTGAVFQAVSTQNDRQKFPAPGQFVDLGGRRMHLLINGQPTNQPTVILDAGIASFSSNWAWVQAELAASTRVVAYDRAGLGWSDPAPQPQDAQESAKDLHAALQKAGIAGPYVMAGHSYGGLVVRAFTDLYPEEVVGMVLVDASHPDQWTHIKESQGGRTVALSNRITSYLAKLGVVRLFNMSAPLTTGLPGQQAGELRAFLARPEAWLTSSGILSIWEERTRPHINGVHRLGDLPLSVISVTEQALYGEVLTELQAELPTLSSNSLHQTVEGATHENLVAQQEHAMVVVDAILKVIQAAQTGQPLAEN